MPYMLMIVEPTGQRREVGLAEGQARYARMLSWGNDLKARGLLTDSQSLKSDTEAVRLRVQDGKRTLIDGPFSEAKEMVGGFFLLSCDSKQQAVTIAGDCPAVDWATVEVREFGPCFL